MQGYVVYSSALEAGRAEAEMPDLKGKRVVIVEDEGIIQLHIQRILSHAGMVIAGTANNGQQGVDLVLALRPDLVLMDVRMPVLNGIQAAEKILESYEVCILMVTAFSDDEYRRQADKIGACGYIVKPIDTTTFVPEIRAALAAYQPPP